jgi:hypothetical protein
MPTMNSISASELASIQADVSAVACDKPCQIQRPNKTGDPYGSKSEPSLITISPNGLKCGMRQPSAGQLQNYDYKIGSLAAWVLVFPVGTNVQEQDYVLVEGQKLVVQVLLDHHSYPALLPVLASEVK